ncbi:hypothetical protein ACFV9C_13735 [Kribbella sp. NPDC059898]
MSEWLSPDRASSLSTIAEIARDEIPAAAGAERGSRLRWDAIPAF